MKIQQRESTRLRKQARDVGKTSVLKTRGRRVKKKTEDAASLQLTDSRAASIWMRMPETKKEKILKRAERGTIQDHKTAGRRWEGVREQEDGWQEEAAQNGTGNGIKKGSGPGKMQTAGVDTEPSQGAEIQDDLQCGQTLDLHQDQQEPERTQAPDLGEGTSRGSPPAYEKASQDRKLVRRVMRKVLRGSRAASDGGAGKGLQTEGGEDISQQQQKAVRQGTAPVRKAVNRAAARISQALLSAVMAFGPAGILILILLLLLLIIMGIFGSMQTGSAQATGISQEVENYRPAVREAAARYEMSEYVELILAVMMQESGGQGTDPMQAAEGAYNTRYPHVPNGITDPAYSIECGVQELKNALMLAGVTGSTDMVNIRIALQAYNFGPGYIQWMQRKGYFEWSFVTACEFAAGTGWGQRADPNSPAGPWSYGDQYYPEHVLRYYTIQQGTGVLPEGGLPIPVYNQNDYQEPYGRGTIAGYGCGPSSFSMVVSYLRNEAISPADVVSWCGNSYYVPWQGTSWNFFEAAADQYGIGAVTTTTSTEEVIRALQEGRPVISSQGPGLFTSGGHYIVLRGITAEGKILVNDPNDNEQKQYNTRPFDLYAEINSTCKQYWVFEPKR